MEITRAGVTSTLLALTVLGCAPKPLAEHPLVEPFDAVVVPGCPSEEDGSPSLCQLGRAGAAALLWRDGWAKNFIVSGSDVHSPYVEAEALAQEMTLLGVPPERIVLERDALHTDENVYYSILVANRLGYPRLAVTSYGSAAAWMCKMMEMWRQPCSPIAIDMDAVGRFLPPHAAALHALRAVRVHPWEPLEARSARIALANGHSRPPSWLLYPLYAVLGPSHRPVAPAHPDPITWAERLRELHSPGE